MKNIIGFIFLSASLCVAQSVSKDSFHQEMDTEEIQTLRSSIPKNITITLSNGEQIEIGRCGFVPFNITEMQNWYFDSDNTDREYLNLNIPVAFHVVYPSGGGSNTNYNVPDYKLDLQIDVLNGIYMGNDPGFSLSQP